MLNFFFRFLDYCLYFGALLELGKGRQDEPFVNFTMKDRYVAQSQRDSPSHLYAVMIDELEHLLLSPPPIVFPIRCTK
jgi:hypothetical protein